MPTFTQSLSKCGSIAWSSHHTDRNHAHATNLRCSMQNVQTANANTSTSTPSTHLLTALNLLSATTQYRMSGTTSRASGLCHGREAPIHASYEPSSPAAAASASASSSWISSRCQVWRVPTMVACLSVQAGHIRTLGSPAGAALKLSPALHEHNLPPTYESMKYRCVALPCPRSLHYRRLTHTRDSASHDVGVHVPGVRAWLGNA